MTTRRWGSVPSDSEVRPSSATTSWHTLRSKGFIASSLTASPVARTLAGLGLNGQAGQLLEGVQDLAVLAHEAIEGFGVVGDDFDRGAAVFDVDFDVAVEVGDVEQFFEVVGGDFAFFFEAGQLVCVVVTHDVSSVVGNGVLLVSRLPAGA